MKRATQILILVAVAAATVMVSLVLFPREPRETEDDTYPTLAASVGAAGPWTHTSLALGASCILAALVLRIARSRRGPALVRTLGHAAFLAGLAGAATWFREGAAVMASLGAATTPADVAKSTDAALVSIVVAAVAETVALGCAGVLRLLPPKPPPIA